LSSLTIDQLAFYPAEGRKTVTIYDLFTYFYFRSHPSTRPR